MEEIILKNFEEFLKIVEDINVAKRYIIKFNKYFDFIGLTEQDIKLYALKLAWSFNKINLTNFLYNYINIVKNLKYIRKYTQIQNLQKMDY